MMKKTAYFASHRYKRWPEPHELEHYFLAPSGKQWFGTGPHENDTAGFWAEGANGTEHLEVGKGRIFIDLNLWGNPSRGVLLIHWKRGGGFDETFTSVGDLTRLKEIVRAQHGTQLPVGLFIPFEEAWKAVKEFIKTDGRLPTSIEWIANKDLPPNTFPPP
jgi:hypothetical protein